MSKCFRGALRLRDNESPLYMIKSNFLWSLYFLILQGSIPFTTDEKGTSERVL